ncbi:DUF4238 domain-containing protein [Sphingosinicella soli]|uniref:DUF4238 domain-containing protein n=1 Tax=Sphingosinicella soli TaxID=333708 RepID=A0A7W7B4Z7_9SPHN|nr:DUF4238 domain-containing protein [Sphingosinicella soli]MBB4633243.1 hypothetical protein [Sphingosinicella soli]
MTRQNNPPKRHHFIPQMMLRHFADDDELLWFWRRDFQNGDIKKTNTQNLFVEKDLYTLVHYDGTKNSALEGFFARLEGAGAQFINDLATIIRGNGIPNLDKNAWNFWNHFFYYHLKRTPGAIAVFAQHVGFRVKVDEAVATIKKIGAEEGRETDDANLEERIVKNAVIMAQRAKPSAEVLEVFAKMGLAIYRIVDRNKSFVIGDIPGATARFRLPDNSMSRPTLFLPVTWDIAVGQSTRSKKVDVITVDHEQIKRMNVATTTRSTVIAGRSDALIKTLSRRVIYTGVEAT